MVMPSQLLPTLSSIVLLSLFALALTATYGAPSPQAGPEEEHAVPGAEGLTVRHTVVAQLGPEHFAHALCRRDARGPHLVAWGDRILEWSLDSAHTQEEVVPLQTGHRY